MKVFIMGWSLHGMMSHMKPRGFPAPVPKIAIGELSISCILQV